MSKHTLLGIDFFHDNQHYHKKAAERWIPELNKLGIGWISLHQSGYAAIPEQFLSILMENNITPIIHFDLKQETVEPSTNYDLLLRAYQSWGVQYISFFTAPNTHSFWKTNTWSSNDIIEYFADIFLPLAESTVKNGMYPILPPLVVAKEYWDTAFLRLLLESLLRRRTSWLFDHLILSAYADIHNLSRPLEWGAGGPERWPTYQPFKQSQTTQDHQGLYIFEWYLAITQATIGKKLPIILLEPELSFSENILLEKLTERRLQVYRWLISHKQNGKSIEENEGEDLSENILCFCFNKLSCASSSQKSPLDWFSLDGFPMEIAEQAEEIYRSFNQRIHHNPLPQADHVLLLPMLGESQLHQQLEQLQPFLLQVQPMISFSKEEALNAKVVSILKNHNPLSENELKSLQDHGCVIQLISPSGTTFASRSLS